MYEIEIVDSLQDASGNITDDTLFDQIRSFIKYCLQEMHKEEAVRSSRKLIGIVILN